MIVIARRVGRLANGLVLFAHFIGAALEHDLVVVNPAFHRHARHFPATARDLACRFPEGRPVPPIPGGRVLLYQGCRAAAEVLHRRQRRGKEVGVIRLSRDQQFDLNGEAFLDLVRRHRVVFVQDWFFRSAANCARHREAIRRHLTPWPHHIERASAMVEPARQRGRLVVGVHLRHTDYRQIMGGRFFYSHAQYRDVMARVEQAFPDREVTFFACSDAPVPADAFAGLDVRWGSGHPVDDLYALAACDRLVGPPSTYTGWASYYGDVPLHRILDPTQPVSDNGFETAVGLTDTEPRVPGPAGGWVIPGLSSSAIFPT